MRKVFYYVTIPGIEFNDIQIKRVNTDKIKEGILKIITKPTVYKYLKGPFKLIRVAYDPDNDINGHPEKITKLYIFNDVTSAMILREDKENIEFIARFKTITDIDKIKDTRNNTIREAAVIMYDYLLKNNLLSLQSFE